MSSDDDKKLRDARFLAGVGAGASEAFSPTFAPVSFSTRKHLGESFAAARNLARLTRADLAAGLGIPEATVAALESGSITFKRGT